MGKCIRACGYIVRCQSLLILSSLVLVVPALGSEANPPGNISALSQSFSQQLASPATIYHSASDPVFEDRFEVRPAIQLDEPFDGLYTNASVVTFAGSVDRPAALKIAGIPVDLDASLAFSAEIVLAEGVNIVQLQAEGPNGGVGRLAVSVTVDSVPPPPANVAFIALSPPENGEVTIEGAPGSIEGGDQVSITNSRTGETVWVTAEEDGSFVAVIEGQVGDGYQFVVQDQAGNQSEPTYFDGGVLNPPPSQPGVINPISDLEDFLYDDDDPVQIIDDPDIFDPDRFAVIRGFVGDREGAALPGVTVRVLGRPEFGQTHTRANGEFDLAVNGGGALTLDYEISGRLPAQRRVQVPWQDYVYADEVALIKLDEEVTVIDLDDPESGTQVARGSIVEDADGPRQATVLFPEGTDATITGSDGEPIELDQLSFRATEYTVGEHGPAMMPAELPPVMAYTYAVELSADEALAEGAAHVEFSQPVAFYVENFLDFPTGTGVPVGYYDRDQGEWVGSDNGAVIEILDIADGEAVLDVTGEGPASQELLDALGINSDELQSLAELYTVGDTLQRAALPHFSPWDLNFPEGPADDASDPPDPDDGPDVPDDEKTECEGCIIYPEDRSLSKQIAVHGTPFKLHYNSRRQPGQRDNFMLRIPVTGPEVHEEVIRAEVSVQIAGRMFKETFNTAPNQVWDFEWDGLDIRGRERVSALATVVVEHVYPMWYSVPEGWQSHPLWGSPPTGIEVNENNRFTFGETSTSQVWQKELGRARVTSSAALGGWTLNAHHAIWDGAFNRIDVQKGYGITNRTRHGTPSIETIGGGGNLAGDEAEGASATEVELFADGISVTEDGSIYTAESGAHQVRRIDPGGTITTIAGTGESGYSGDGGPAVEAELWSPTAVDVASDGTLYIAETGGNRRIRRVSPEGTIDTVAGDGSTDYAGDGSDALETGMLPTDVVEGPDGALFVADSSNHRIYRIDPRGIISTVAGNGTPGASGDGGPATDAEIRIYRLTVTDDGLIYFSDWNNGYIRRVGRDGIIETVVTAPALVAPQGIAMIPAGGFVIADDFGSRVWEALPGGALNLVAGDGSWDPPDGDGGPATSASVNQPWDVAFSPDGALYIVGAAYGRIRKVEEPSGAVTRLEDSIAVPSRRKDELYLFDRDGRHLETRHAITGATLFSFDYDAESRLISIADGDGNETVIERTVGGSPIAIVAPDGQRTVLAVDANGYLGAVIDPMGASWHPVHNEDGLLTAFADRRGKTTEYFYNEMGQLVADIDPEGGGWSIDGETDSTSLSTSMQTAEGRSFQFDVEVTAPRVRKHTRIDPDGLETITWRDIADATTSIHHPDGTDVFVQKGPDPRHGMMSPLPEQTNMNLPSGLTLTRTLERTAMLEDEVEAGSLAELTDRVTINSRESIAHFDASTLSWALESPSGRQATLQLNEQGRPVASHAGGLAPVSIEYDERGRPGTLVSGEANTAREFIFSYHEDGDQAGYLASITDPIGRELSFGYDANGRVIEQVQPDDRVIDFSYDGEGNLTAVIPPGRDAHVFDYTGVGNRSLYAPPELPEMATITLYRYNADRQLTEIERPDGEILTFGYDSAGRLSSIDSDAVTVDYSYDSETGQLTDIVTSDGIGLAYQWDGFLSTAEVWSGPVTGSVERTFDSNFWLVEETAADHSVTFAYDDDGLLTDAGGLNLTRHPENGLLTGTSKAEIIGSRSHNAFGELTERTVTVEEIPVYQANYERDAIGRIEEQIQIINGSTDHWGYHYDTAGRLEAVERNGATEHVYVYDDNGNRIEHIGPGGTITADYDEQDRLVQYGDIVYTHTEAGERLTRTDGEGTTHYNYDAATNLREVTLPDGTTIEYLIDGRDRRVGKKVNGTLQKTWIYRDQLSPVAQFDGDGNMTHRFVYAEQVHSPSYIIKIDPATEEETEYRVISDHLGSVRLVIDVETGTIVQRMDYGPFGEVLFDSNPGFQSFGFVGGLYDRDTGLVRFGARDYDPQIGRWTAKDPIGFAGGDPNLYGYVLADPINFIDPLGLDGSPVIGEVDRDVRQIQDYIRRFERARRDRLTGSGDVDYQDPFFIQKRINELREELNKLMFDDLPDSARDAVNNPQVPKPGRQNRWPRPENVLDMDFRLCQ